MSSIISSPICSRCIGPNVCGPSAGNFSCLSKQLQLSFERVLDSCKQQVGLRASVSRDALMRRSNFEVTPSAECDQQLRGTINPKCVNFTGKSCEHRELVFRNFVGDESQRSDGIITKSTRIKLRSDFMKHSTQLKKLEVKRDRPGNRSESLHLALMLPRLLYRSLSIPSLLVTYSSSLGDAVTTRLHRNKDRRKSGNRCNKSNNNGCESCASCHHYRRPVGHVAPIRRKQTHHLYSLILERILP